MPRPVSLTLRICAWCAVLLWALTITVLSSMTPRQIHEIAPFDLWDKAAHFVAFAAGAVTLSVALHWSTVWTWTRVVLLAAVAIALFGALDEFHQTFTPHRTGGDLFDWIADALGAVAGALLTALFHARSTRTTRLAPARD